MKEFQKLNEEIKQQTNRLNYLSNATSKNKIKIQNEIQKTEKIEYIKQKVAKWNLKLKKHEELLKLQELKAKQDIQSIYDKSKKIIELKKQKILEEKKIKAEQLRDEKKHLKQKSVHLKQKEFQKKRNKYLKMYSLINKMFRKKYSIKN